MFLFVARRSQRNLRRSVRKRRHRAARVNPVQNLSLKNQNLNQCGLKKHSINQKYKKLDIQRVTRVDLIQMTTDPEVRIFLIRKLNRFNMLNYVVTWALSHKHVPIVLSHCHTIGRMTTHTTHQSFFLYDTNLLIGGRGVL